ncbi:MAG: trypsin-like peptidase domain-containing protein, partial [Firmicutes bacterium]|nr:trypsin-like peptidase domain-containing protein [Bacillota bacterium]
MVKKTLKFLVFCLIVATVLSFSACNKPEVRLDIYRNYIDYQAATDDVTAMLSQQVMPSVVEIRALKAGSTTGTQGTGVIVGTDSSGYPYILTNYHVIADGLTVNGRIEIRVHLSMTYFKTQAAYLGGSETMDLALLKLPVADPVGYGEEGKNMIARWGNSSDLMYGQRVLAFGNGIGNGVSVCEGIVGIPELTTLMKVKGTNTDIVRRIIQHSAPINSGNSGGALVDMAGKLVGINTWKVDSTADGTTSVNNICYAIPANYCRAVVDNIIRNNGLNAITFDKIGIAEFSTNITESTAGIQEKYLAVSKVVTPQYPPAG